MDISYTKSDEKFLIVDDYVFRKDKWGWNIVSINAHVFDFSEMIENSAEETAELMIELE